MEINSDSKSLDRAYYDVPLTNNQLQLGRWKVTGRKNTNSQTSLHKQSKQFLKKSDHNFSGRNGIIVDITRKSINKPNNQRENNSQSGKNQTGCVGPSPDSS